MGPTKAQAASAANILAREWDPSGAIAGADAASAYAEWGYGIADMIQAGAPTNALVEYLGTLEEQLGVERSPERRREQLAVRLTLDVRGRVD